MNEQAEILTMETEKPHDHKILYVASGLSVITIVLLVVVLTGMVFKNNKSTTVNSSLETTQPSSGFGDQTSNGQNMTQPPTALPTGVIPRMIKNQQDIEAAIKEMDASTQTMNSVSTGLDQNIQDASSFSQ